MKKIFLSLILVLSFLLIPPKPVYSDESLYHIMVNTYTNSLTIYKLNDDGIYEPIKAMLCSAGGKNTPLGTFYTSSKYRWRALFYNVYGQYATRITGPILFHSVPYLKQRPDTLQRGEFEKLGQTASHGCIRLSVEDVKWIYDNCPYRTKVTIYQSKNPGPLGKPDNIEYKIYTGYDPTDIWSNNPYLESDKKPTIDAPKKIVIAPVVSTFNFLSGVTAKSFDGKDLTEKIDFEDNIDLQNKGTYRITYSVTDSYGNTSTATTRVIVK